MKRSKWILSLILCLFAVFFVACSKGTEMQSGETHNELSVNKSEATLEVGETFRIAAVCGAETVAFESANEAVATVSETGMVTAVSEGTTYIMISAGEQSKSCKISVVAYEYAITLNETNVLTVVGVQKKIEVTYKRESDKIDGNVVWSVTEESKCTLTETTNGVIFRANEKGIYTLTATAQKGETATCVLKVMATDATVLETPQATVNGETVSWTAVENATAYLVKVDNGVWTETTDLSYTVTDAEAVYVRAIASESCDYYESAVATVYVK